MSFEIIGEIENEEELYEFLDLVKDKLLHHFNQNEHFNSASKFLYGNTLDKAVADGIFILKYLDK